MRSKTLLMFLIASLVVSAAALAAGVARQSENASPVFGVTLPPDYRTWQMISVAHEAGSLNDIRVVLGNDIALRAYRNGTRPFPDGTIIARLAYKMVPSAQNNAAFGQEQSFVASDPTNVQIDVKDSRKYAATGGWGFGQFENGKVNPSETLINTCYVCHNKLPKSEDLVFTHYSP
ncbi:MAG TPA: cytochrome P460 family protein [Rhizomicrobium sp.]|jgi:hypothetical protein